jgi:hypothetical protein
MFKEGDTVKQKNGPFVGRSVEVVAVLTTTTVTAYKCVTATGELMLLFDKDVESVWEHDMKMFNNWTKEVYK